MLGSINFIKADLLSMSDLLKTLESAHPRFIIHLASFSSVAYSWQHPIESFMNNSNIFLNLLEAVNGPLYPCCGARPSSTASSPEMLQRRAPEPVSLYAMPRLPRTNGSVFAHGFA
jgi:GDP-D-mannose dehydratase